MIVLLVLIGLGFSSQESQNDLRYIGIPTGSPGLIVRYITGQPTKGGRIKLLQFSPYTLYDCCGSATQYAMGSGRLDMAVMCTESALTLVKKNRQYIIAGPVIQNSDILVTREGIVSYEAAIAVSQKRMFQHQIVKERFGPHSRPVPMLHSAVPFAYGRGVVQGAVVDITQAFNLPGILSPAVEKGRPNRVTHVMVIKKSLQENKGYHLFMDRYARAVDRMQRREDLLHLLKTYVSEDMTIGEVDTWEKMNIRFMYPLNSRQQG